MNETPMWLVIFAIILCFGSLILLFTDLAVFRKTGKKLEKFDKWYKEYEKDRKTEKEKVMADFLEWCEKYKKENKDD